MSCQRLLIVILCLILSQSYLNAQEKSKVQFGKVSPEDFTLPTSSIIDSNASAVILSDKGSTHFIGNKQGWFSYVFRKEIRIKIINKKAFEAATVEVRLYGKDDYAEKLDNLGAATYNLEDGKVVEARLDKKEIFEEKLDKERVIRKFTMPAVKEGSIIEYGYTVTSAYIHNLPPWEFQSTNYPCLRSEYEVIIPQTLSYVFVKQGVHTFFLDKAGEGSETYRVTEKEDGRSLASLDKELYVSAHTLKHNWAMKDIPALYEEGYLSTPRNYVDKLEFQLSQTNNGEDIWDHKNNWKKATEELLNDENFGLPLSQDNEWLDPLLDKIGANSSDPLKLAKAIYYYVSSHFTCTNYYDKYIKTTLRDVVKKNSGTVGDINLLLIAMLRKKGIGADPVLLSTREYGFNLIKYPVMDRLNYVIARVGIGHAIYYLDAAHSQLGFGQLPGDCYNGHARIISQKDSGSVYFYADSLKEKRMTMVLLANNEKGEIEGSYQSTLGDLASYNTRVKVEKIGQKEFFKNIQTAYGEDLDIGNAGIDSLDRPEKPVHIHYDLHLKQAVGSAMIYFNPLFVEAYPENPFQAAERKYPVEMHSAFDDIYIFNMEVPAGYAVEELPKSARVAFNGTDGMFEYLVASQGNTIQLRARVRMDRAYFPPEDYPGLRDFFAYIVKKESEQIVLKKKP